MKTQSYLHLAEKEANLYWKSRIWVVIRKPGNDVIQLGHMYARAYAPFSEGN